MSRSVRLVKRDYVPLNVDESEFEVRAEARQGASLAAMKETIDKVEAELAGIDGIRYCPDNRGDAEFWRRQQRRDVRSIAGQSGTNLLADPGFGADFGPAIPVKPSEVTSVNATR